MSAGECRPLIIGAVSDPHVRGVCSAIDRAGGKALVVDALTLREGGFTLHEKTLFCCEGAVSLSAGRGWIRRMAPHHWIAAGEADALQTVERHAFLSLLAGVARMTGRQWITSFDRLGVAEDRVWQLQRASAIGIDTPAWLITSDAEAAAGVLGERFVVKPIRTGYFHTATGDAMAVFASMFDVKDADLADFGAAPFFAQEAIAADEHLRVVTVGASAWVASLSARNLPLDWRANEHAHRSWTATEDDEVATAATTLALEVGVGFSSQDWIRSDGRLTFLDLNPSGQWLFLPEPLASDVAAAIARVLVS